MTKKIQETLLLIEQAHQVKIIYACESGSRAWGFESKDSDWDIRFIYVSQLDHYLSVFPNIQDVLDINNSSIIKDIIKHQLDFVGWDISKVLFNLSKGNPDLISWFLSPIVYKKQDNYYDVIHILAMEFFKPISTYYHYLHMATKNYNQYIKNPEEDVVNTKKYLYVLRPILACIWLELTGLIPPMKFNMIYESPYIQQYLGALITKEIEELVLKKKNNLELDKQQRNSILDKFIEKEIIKYTNLVKNINLETRPDIKIFNKIFQRFIKGEVL